MQTGSSSLSSVAPGLDAARCPVCATGFEDEPVRCPRCSAPHHRECWEYVGGCAIFACDQAGARGPVEAGHLERLQGRLVEVSRRQSIRLLLATLLWPTFFVVALSFSEGLVLFASREAVFHLRIGCWAAVMLIQVAMGLLDFSTRRLLQQQQEDEKTLLELRRTSKGTCGRLAEFAENDRVGPLVRFVAWTVVCCCSGLTLSAYLSGFAGGGFVGGVVVFMGLLCAFGAAALPRIRRRDRQSLVALANRLEATLLTVKSDEAAGTGAPPASAG